MIFGGGGGWDLGLGRNFSFGQYRSKVIFFAGLGASIWSGPTLTSNGCGLAASIWSGQTLTSNGCGLGASIWSVPTLTSDCCGLGASIWSVATPGSSELPPSAGMILSLVVITCENCKRNIGSGQVLFNAVSASKAI